MRSFLKRLAGPIARLMEPELTVLDGTKIPAPHLRYGGQNFATDCDFLDTAEREGRRLVEAFGLHSGSRLLEIGCGPGRLATGILRVLGDITSYVGLDVRADAVAWGNQHIGAEHPSFRFQHVDVHNDRYNPDGDEFSKEVALPVGNEPFDIAYLYSVFSHMTLEDTRRYLAAIHDVLKPGGRLFFTTFAEEGVTDFAVNPADYKREWSGELHCVRFARAFLEDLVREHGFALDEFHYGAEADGQSALHLTRTG